MLQKWQMNALYSTLAVPIRRSFFAAAILVGSWFLCGEAFAQITPDPQSQPQITKSPQGKQEEAARAAARGVQFPKQDHTARFCGMGAGARRELLQPMGRALHANARFR